MLLLNSLPNALLPKWDEQALVIEGISEDMAIEALSEGFESFVGRKSFAEVLSKRTGLHIPTHRGKAPPLVAHGTKAIVALVQPPRRLAEGEKWTEEQILSMPISWIRVMGTSTHYSEVQESYD